MKKKKIYQIIDKAINERPLTDAENRVIVSLNRIHNKKCPGCQQKGGILKRFPFVYTKKLRKHKAFWK